MNPLTQPLATLIAWWRAKPHDERGGIQITTENLLWTLLVIAIVGIVGGVFSATAGSLLALTGSPVNIIVSNGALASGARRFAFFEFALAGAPLLIATILIVILFGDRLLPNRTVTAIPPDLGAHSRTLREQYDLPDDTLIDIRKGVAEVVIPPRSGLIGRHVFPGMTTASGDLVVLRVQRAGEDLTGREIALQAGWSR